MTAHRPWKFMASGRNRGCVDFRWGFAKGAAWRNNCTFDESLMDQGAWLSATGGRLGTSSTEGGDLADLAKRGVR